MKRQYFPKTFFKWNNLWLKNREQDKFFYLQGNFYRNGFKEFYLYPSIIFYKQDIPKLDEEINYEMKIRGIKICLVGKHYVSVEVCTRIYEKNKI